MANNLNIKEVTLAQISDSTHAINVVGTGATNGRVSVYQPAVVRVTDSDYDTTAETDDPELMALFYSKGHGQPWDCSKGAKSKVVHRGAAPIATGTDQNLIFPDFDYTTFA